MLEGLCSVVSFSLLVLTSNMIQPMARRSYFPITSSHEAKPLDNSNEDGAIRKYYPINIDTPVGKSRARFGENDFLGAIIKKQQENCKTRGVRGVILTEKYNDPDSDLLNNTERPEKFDYFRRAEDVMLNPVLPAGTPMNFHKQYSVTKYSRNHKTRYLIKLDL